MRKLRPKLILNKFEVKIQKANEHKIFNYQRFEAL